METQTLDNSAPIQLLFAEDLTEQQLPAKSHIAAMNLSRPMRKFIRAWDNLDLAMSTSNEAYADYAFAGFDSLAGSESYDLTQLPYVGVRMVLAFEQAFRLRVRQQTLDRTVIDYTYQRLGSVVDDVLSEPKMGEDLRYGTLAEQLVLGSLIRSKNELAFPYPASRREESNSEHPTANHDAYIILQKDGDVRKIPYQVKFQYKAHLGPFHPDVRVVNVLQTIRKAKSRLRNGSDPSTFTPKKLLPVKQAEVAEIAKIMADESQSKNLPLESELLLGAVTETLLIDLIHAQAHADKTNARAANPLTYKIGHLFSGLDFQLQES